MRRCDKSGEKLSTLSGEVRDDAAEAGAVYNGHPGKSRNIRLNDDLCRSGRRAYGHAHHGER
jgi:hypothetical protein